MAPPAPTGSHAAGSWTLLMLALMVAFLLVAIWAYQRLDRERDDGEGW
jgi:hypothetical protein